MMWSSSSGPTEPWNRVRGLLSSEFIGNPANWRGNWGQYSNARIDEILAAIPQETDPAKLKELYTEAVKIYLTAIPSFTLMYRPELFHTVHETVWTNYPQQDDGITPPIPPLNHLTHIAPAGVVRFIGGGISGDGSPQNPYANVEEAVQNAPDDTTLIFKAGSDNTFASASWLPLRGPCRTDWAG